MWVASSELPRSAGNPFYERLNRVLGRGRLRCLRRGALREVLRRRRRPAESGAGPLLPDAAARLLRRSRFGAGDCVAGRRFAESSAIPGRPAHETSPDHSTVSRTRRRIDLETHQAVFTWVLQRLTGAGFVKSKTIGIDATTLEAMRRCGASSAGTPVKATRRSCAAWPPRQALRRRHGRSWPGWTGSGRRSGPCWRPPRSDDYDQLVTKSSFRRPLTPSGAFRSGCVVPNPAPRR